MIRIELFPEPQWLVLGHGVRLKLMPLTTAMMVSHRNEGVRNFLIQVS